MSERITVASYDEVLGVSLGVVSTSQATRLDMSRTLLKSRVDRSGPIPGCEVGMGLYRPIDPDVAAIMQLPHRNVKWVRFAVDYYNGGASIIFKPLKVRDAEPDPFLGMLVSAGRLVLKHLGCHEDSSSQN